MSTKPFTTDEVIQAVAIKLKEIRAEAEVEREKMRAEIKAELMALRGEFLRDRLDLERGMQRRTGALPVIDMTELN